MPLSKKDKIPAPGVYEYKNYFGKEGPKYTMRKKYGLDGKNIKKSKSGLFEKDSSPGPGSYDIKDNKGTPAYTIGFSNIKELKKEKNELEVGKYNLRNDKLLFGNSGNIFNKSPRYEKFQYKDDIYNTPAPNFYTYNYEKLSSKTPVYGFSKSVRFNYERDAKNDRFNTPGPGQYEQKSLIQLKSSPYFTFFKEKKFFISKKEENNNPASNKYFPKIDYHPNSSVYTIAKSIRKDNSQDKYKINFPGPGFYNPKFKILSRCRSDPLYTISLGPRGDYDQEKKDKDNLVGPGSNTITNGMMTKSPKYTIRIKHKQEKKDLEVPSPTRYNISMFNRPKEPKYSIGKSTREDDLKQTIKDDYPGPASYQTKDSTGTAKLFRFSKGIFNKKVDNGVPGPGFYKILCRFNDINEDSRSKGVYKSEFKFV